MTTEISTQTQPRGLALQTMADAMRFGEMVAQSDFAPKDFRGKPASCVLAIQAGAEIGLSPMQALQSIAVVNGRPSIFGDAALAVVKASPVCEYVTESVDGDGEQMVATCTAKRRGYPSPTVSTFSVADAKKAGLWGKSGPWTQYPRRMLQMRARGFALRDCFPDALRGMVTAEEAGDYQIDASREPAREPVVVTRVQPAAAAEEPLFDRISKRIGEAVTVTTLDKIGDRVEALAGEGQLTSDQATELHNRIGRRHEQIAPAQEAANGMA